VSELIENILSFLQPKEIISCRRLSTTIRNAIDGSSLLKERMFPQITREPQQSWRIERLFNGHGKGITSVRPIFGLRRSPYFVPENFEISVNPSRIRTSALLNPAFSPSLLFESREREPDAYHYGGDCDSITLSADDPLLKYADVQDRCTPSLLGMYLTNPPCLAAWFYFKTLRLPARLTRVEFSAKFQRATGITVGEPLNFASVVKGVGAFHRPKREPPTEREREALPYPGEEACDCFDDVTMVEFLELLNAEDEDDPVELHGELCYEFLDTIIPTDRIWAGVAPYVETGAEPRYLPDEDWSKDSEEEVDEEADASAEDEADGADTDEEG